MRGVPGRPADCHHGRVDQPPAVTAADIDELVVGVTLLGSGGGGDAGNFAQLLRRRLGAGSRRLHRPGQLTDHTVVPVGVVGATSVFLEKLPGGHELTGAVEAISRWVDAAVTAVMPLEAGGLNGIAALVAAVELDLPLLDVDLMGRALPRLDQVSWATKGMPIAPCGVSEPGGQVLVVDGATPSDLERTVRSFLVHAGGWAALALRPVPVSMAVPNAIPGSLARALELGRAHATLPEAPDPEEIENALNGRVLGAGRIQQIARNQADATRSTIHLQDTTSGSVVRIEAQNEYLLVLVDGRPAASTPDLVCLLDRRTALPIAVDRLRSADDVLVLTLPGPTWWHDNDGERFVGPTSFGIEPVAAELR